MIELDGSRDGVGIALRTALALSAATGQGFTMTRIAERRPQPGLRPEHLAAVRAAALTCDAKTGGAFDRSPDLRFEPGPVEAGQFTFDLAGPGPATTLLQMMVVPLATASADTVVAVAGGTHVPDAPSAHYLQRQWAPAVERLGMPVSVELRKAGFAPPGGGEVQARVMPWTRPTTKLKMDARGPLVALRGLAGAARGKVDLAQKMVGAGRAQLWESRRLEAEWDTVALNAPSPGSFLLTELEFEQSRAVFCTIGERRTKPDVLAQRLVRTTLAFLDGEAAVDPYLPDQIAVPLALGRAGGVVSTSELTGGLARVVEVLNLFGCPAVVTGRIGGPGVLEVPAW